MTTAGEQINGALRLLGVLAEGETPSAETSQDALSAMNQMIDSWNTERLSVYATQDQVLTWPTNQRVRTLGHADDAKAFGSAREWQAAAVVFNSQAQPIFVGGELYREAGGAAMTDAVGHGLLKNPEDSESLRWRDRF
jgi:hypothetical protein